MNIIPIPESMTKKSGRIKMKKRVLVALLATALTVSMMTGCGNKKTEDTSSTKTEETSEDSDQEAALSSRYGDYQSSPYSCPIPL